MGRRARPTSRVIDELTAAELLEKLAALQAAGQLTPRHAELLRDGIEAVTLFETDSARQRERNRWVAIDFRAHRGVQGREKIVATRWGLHPRQVAKIGGRYAAHAAMRMAGAHTDVQWRSIIAHIVPLYSVTVARTD